MNDNLKSVVFVAAALVVTAVAWAVHRSSLPTDELAEYRNQPLFPDFTDPLRATSLEIIKYDENKGEAKPFQVAQVKGRWCIPSHADYPADAKDHMVQAATSVMGLVALDVVSRDRRDHPLYGVVDPGENIEPGTKGVGTRVVLKDKDGQTLIGLVIGKEAGTSRESDDQKDLRYVRKIGEDPVYVVKLNPDKLSTDFADWIEKDLLKLNAWDIKHVAIQDYSFDIRPTPDGLIEPRMDQRAVIRLEHNDTGDPRWKLTEAVLVQDGKPVRPQLAPDEELNTKKLDDLKYAVDDLKIVDVAKKPPVLSGSLRATGKMKLDRNSVMSLADRGFYLVQTEQGMELFSSEGEIRVTTKDGVQYILRFGRIASAEAHSTAKKDEGKKAEGKSSEAKKEERKKEGEKKPDAKEEKKPDSGKDSTTTTASVNRYLFVMAQFDPSVIEKPKLEPLPPEPKPEPAKEPASKEAKKEEAPKPEAKKEEGKPTQDKKDDTKKDDTKKEETKPDPKAERERIEKENKQKTDEYNKKLEEGKKKVEELNARFADWYYVISDEVYQKIHLGYKDIVQKKEKKEEEGKKDQPATEAQVKPATETPAASKDQGKSMPGTKPEAKPEPKPEAKPAAKSEASPEAKAEPKPSPQPAAKAEPKSEAKAQTSSAPQADTKPQGTPAPPSEPGPAAKPAPKAEGALAPPAASPPTRKPESKPQP